MYKFYNIVPKDDGCNQVAVSKSDNHYILPRLNKAPIGKQLIFNTKEEAQEYINTYLDDTYEISWVCRIDRFICPECGAAIEIRCAVGADESVTGYTELLGSCRNDYCALDWEIKTDNEDNLISIQRKFWG